MSQHWRYPNPAPKPWPGWSVLTVAQKRRSGRRGDLGCRSRVPALRCFEMSAHCPEAGSVLRGDPCSTTDRPLSARESELDRLLTQRAVPSRYIPPPAPVMPRTDHYELGCGDPVIVPDEGAGVWKAKPIGAAYIALQAAIFDVLPSANVVIGDDAVKHMVHYLGNSGDRYTIDLEGMLREVPSAREPLEDEAAQTQEFIEMLPPGRHSIRSRNSEDGYNRKDESWNWFFATGTLASR